MSLASSSKAFSVSAPKTWNSVSHDSRDVELLSTFRYRLKTELFNIAYQAINA